jgi:hypothetical protein
MRYLGLLVTLAIIYYCYSRFSAVAPNSSEPDPTAPLEVNSPIDPLVQSTPAPVRPGPSRQPLDRTRTVIDGINRSRQDAEF